MLAKSKFNSIEILISQALIDMDISHEKYITFFKEKDRYERMKENIRDKNENKKQEIYYFFLVYIKILEITKKNFYKCDLEAIVLNDSQYFWINLKDFEVVTGRNWQNIFNNHANSSTLKYRKEFTPDIQFQLDRTFTKNDLFERIIRSCKATTVEFLMLKEKLVLCPYEVICNEEEFILMPEI